MPDPTTTLADIARVLQAERHARGRLPHQRHDNPGVDGSRRLPHPIRRPRSSAMLHATGFDTVEHQPGDAGHTPSICSSLDAAG